MSPKTKKRKQFEGKANPHIGAMLKKHITDNRLYQSSWARRQGVLPATIVRYFKKPSMQISTLFTICQVLNFNFFKAIAEALPVEMKPDTANPLEAEKNELKKEIEKLKIELAVWKEAALRK